MPAGTLVIVKVMVLCGAVVVYGVSYSENPYSRAPQLVDSSRWLVMLTTAVFGFGVEISTVGVVDACATALPIVSAALTDETTTAARVALRMASFLPVTVIFAALKVSKHEGIAHKALSPCSKAKFNRLTDSQQSPGWFAMYGVQAALSLSA
ncbi:hypothetical protein [Mycobacterium sp. OTB74]|uniref:hypothetical protein n=1 Tax=Mycobacterium sp. OTB74 TaxID=1853452 RepID=UPI002476FD32|nr:hypothetical protein [Mycobacterium sp. OTB74]MDH6245824.1 hypothetical protein [Mycobacterium sp. OTB74]